MIEKNKPNEFDIIRRFFSSSPVMHAETLLGTGDDAALVEVPMGQSLTITTDTLVEGVHFLKGTLPEDIGHKSLAVNLSDLSAMGASPYWFTLALTLPNVDEAWLQGFSKGLFDLSKAYTIQLIGGDLTHGPLSITIQALGCVERGRALRRDAAIIGDLIYVTHSLGDAALALRFLQGHANIKTPFREKILERLNRPVPQVAIGKKLLGIAHAAIDISDGLLADLKHILEQSGKGARINIDRLPLSQGLRESVSLEEARQLALTGGDDYELCFTVPKDKVDCIDFECSCIGEIVGEPGLELLDDQGKRCLAREAGYLHF